MIMKFLQKVPAGLMLVPLLIGAVIHTLFPQALEIGGLTTAAFSNAGAATCMGLQLFCLGTTLQLKDMPAVLKRGGTLLLSKFLIGAILGIVVGKVFGQAGFWGLTALSIVAGVTNSNGSLYLSLVKTYGDEADAATVALLALNDGPFFTLLALGASGMASIPMMSLVAVIVPMVLGMIIGKGRNFQAVFWNVAYYDKYWKCRQINDGVFCTYGRYTDTICRIDTWSRY